MKSPMRFLKQEIASSLSHSRIFLSVKSGKICFACSFSLFTGYISLSLSQSFLLDYGFSIRFEMGKDYCYQSLFLDLILHMFSSYYAFRIAAFIMRGRFHEFVTLFFISSSFVSQFCK